MGKAARRVLYGMLTTAGMTLVAAAAFAAAPKAGARYHGTGTDYMNNAPKWTAEGTGKVSFAVSTSGTEVRNFKGTYSFYCGAGTSWITARRMAISKRGRFAAKFSQPAKGPNGKVDGTDYATVDGAFIDHGRKARVRYLFDYVGTGTTIKHPYSTSDPRALGCASWVKATVSAG